MRPKDQPLSPLKAVLVVFTLLLVAGIGWGLFFAGKHFLLQRQVKQAIPAYLNELKVQMERLSGAIEKYHSQFGFYPANHSTNAENHARWNPLYYELVGTRWNTNYQTFGISTSKHTINPDTMAGIFNMRSFSNTSAHLSWPTNFIDGLQFTGREESEIVLVSCSAPDSIDADVDAAFTTSPWRYVADPAEHNKGKFDLWIEVAVFDQHFVVKNWDATR